MKGGWKQERMKLKEEAAIQRDMSPQRKKG